MPTPSLLFTDSGSPKTILIVCIVFVPILACLKQYEWKSTYVFFQISTVLLILYKTCTLLLSNFIESRSLNDKDEDKDTDSLIIGRRWDKLKEIDRTNLRTVVSTLNENKNDYEYINECLLALKIITSKAHTANNDSIIYDEVLECNAIHVLSEVVDLYSVDRKSKEGTIAGFIDVGVKAINILITLSSDPRLKTTLTSNPISSSTSNSDEDDDDDIETLTPSGDLIKEVKSFTSETKSREDQTPSTSTLPISMLLKHSSTLLTYGKSLVNNDKNDVQTVIVTYLSRLFLLVGSLTTDPANTPALLLVDEGCYSQILNSISYYRNDKKLVNLGLFAVFNLGFECVGNKAFFCRLGGVGSVCRVLRFELDWNNNNAKNEKSESEIKQSTEITHQAIGILFDVLRELSISDGREQALNSGVVGILRDAVIVEEGRISNGSGSANESGQHILQMTKIMIDNLERGGAKAEVKAKVKKGWT